MRRPMIATLVLAALLAMTMPVLAGGYAVVRLDEEPGDVFVEKPWTFGFMVLQHDVTPNSDVTPVLRAQHKETGEEITTTGQQEGAVGHFVAEVTFPRAGEWKWSIHPEPFAETSFETLTVLDGLDAGAAASAATGSAPAYAAQLLSGTCATPGAVAFSLGNVSAPAGEAGAELLAVKSAAFPIPVAIGAATIDVPLSALTADEHAIAVGSSAAVDSLVACGDIAGVARGNELAFGLQQWHDSGETGVVVLRAEGDRTAVTLYLLAVDQAAPVASGETMTVEILEDWIFQPYALQAAPGTTVTWVNTSSIAHTVTVDDLAFDDSGLIEPGESFSLTFDEPGAYHYRCAPHPGMEGVIVVA